MRNPKGISGFGAKISFQKHRGYLSLRDSHGQCAVQTASLLGRIPIAHFLNDATALPWIMFFMVAGH